MKPADRWVELHHPGRLMTREQAYRLDNPEPSLTKKTAMELAAMFAMLFLVLLFIAWADNGLQSKAHFVEWLRRFIG